MRQTIWGVVACVTLTLAVGCGGGQKTGSGGAGGGGGGGGGDDDGGETSAAGGEMVPPEKYDEIEREFRNKRPVISRCYTQALGARTIPEKAAGRVTITLGITADGAPVDVRVTDSTLKQKVVEDCVIQTVSGWRLPMPGVKTEYSYSYEFQTE